MKVSSLTTRFQFSLIAVLMVLAVSGSHPSAQERSHHRGPAPAHPSPLVNAVRESTARFHDVSLADAEGYALMFGCVSGPDSGAMGMHFVNLPLAGDAVLDPARPEIVIYEPTPSGRLRLVGADFLVFKDVWDAQHPDTTPKLMGQLLHLIEAPNRYGLPAFYTLHVWAWKENPTGTFANWHSKVSCDAFNPQ
jgi:hypothetical protein